MTAPEILLDGRVQLYGGDCLTVLDLLSESSLDACVTDPPYHLASIVKRFGGESAAGAKDYSGDASRPNATGAFARSSRGFMGKTWDGGNVAFEVSTWRKVYRVLKPGAHLVAFGAPKNVGHLQIAIEGAGFEVRDCLIDLIDLDPVIAQFVASLNDEQRAAFLRCLDESSFGSILFWIFGSGFPKSHNVGRKLGPQWDGWGTALKPAFEPIILARKPLIGTVAENVLAHGTGALHIDACRVAAADDNPSIARRKGGIGHLSDRPAAETEAEGRIASRTSPETYRAQRSGELLGRWPANVLTDGSEAATEGFPETHSAGAARDEPGGGSYDGSTGIGFDIGRWQKGFRVGDAGGSASRFFYTAKADSDDRLGSKHPTVKPVSLMQWLVRLVCRKGGMVLDPFAGTGTTGEAAFREGMSAVLIEREEQYREDIRRRMSLALGGPEERAVAAIKEKIKDKPVDAGPLFGGEG